MRRPVHVPDLRIPRAILRPAASASGGCANGSSSEGLDGFLVPRADEHQGEYVAPGSERLRWLTGFAGSAGVALILRERAHIFVDGRYTLQVRDQVDLSIFTLESLVETPPPAWIEQEPRQGRAHRLRSVAAHDRRRQGAARGGREGRRDAGAGRAATRSTNCGPTGPRRRSARSRSSRSPMPASSPGTSWRGLPPSSPSEGVAHTVLTDPSSIAWAFNIRGSDVPHTPLALAFAILSAEGPHLLFIDERKLGIEAEGLSDPARRPARAGRARCRAGAACRRRRQDRRSTRRSPPSICARMSRRAAARWCQLADPARLPRATKNADRDRRHARRAPPRRRGDDQDARLARPPGAWLARRDHRGRRSSRNSAARPARKRRCRCATSPSTPSPAPGRTARSCITASRTAPTASSQAGELFLLDSGAQYQDGTTDITRTVAIGAADRGDARALHDRAQGHGRHLDAALSRRARAAATSTPSPGSPTGRPASTMRMAPATASAPILSVHEGPQRIAKTGSGKAAGRHDPLQRARLLPRRRLRHPHREPDPGHAGRSDPGRRHRHAWLRDADAGAVRPAADRHRDC